MGPKTQINANKRRQTRTNAKSENFTHFYAPPSAAAQIQEGKNSLKIKFLGGIFLGHQVPRCRDIPDPCPGTCRPKAYASRLFEVPGFGAANQPAPCRGLSGPSGPKCRKSPSKMSLRVSAPGAPKSLQKVSGTVRKSMPDITVTTAVPDNGNAWRKFRVVPRSYPLRSLVCYFV